MVTVTFKAVGQGDTIVLEWERNGEPTIGIIDCKKEGSHVPALEHILARGYKEVFFLALSHPHWDHFSGMRDLLNVCEQEGIQIQYFLHTCSPIDEFFQVQVGALKEENERARLLKKIDSLRDKQVVRKICDISDNARALELGPDCVFIWLSPNYQDRRKYIKSAKEFDLTSRSNPSYNWLCASAAIRTPDKFLFLTADIHRITFRRAFRGFLKSGESLVAGQVPHHGAHGNFDKALWTDFSRGDDAIAAISVGDNSYGHPGGAVINHLESCGYVVQMTGQNMTRDLGSPKTKKQAAKLAEVGKRTTAKKHRVTFQHARDIVVSI